MMLSTKTMLQNQISLHKEQMQLNEEVVQERFNRIKYFEEDSSKRSCMIDELKEALKFIGNDVGVE